MSYVYNPVRDLIGVAKIHIKRSPVRDDIPETKDEYRLAPIVEEIFLFFKKPFDCAQGDKKMKQIAGKKTEPLLRQFTSIGRSKIKNRSLLNGFDG
ncbi:hypothetical protein GCM10022386_20730 [Flavobacterium cheonhonense]|jgi:hypothetical protein|uniref:Uncharacterized protein n=1 Tax=Flavobacterium cheonhonense TaxID=706185 RepID=A0ABP7U3V4_9FLAO|nr:hypothetical protein [Flavobacterium cheonhonense]